MITLSRLNGVSFVLNSELIKTIETVPDTILTLTSGEKLIVRESAQDVVEAVRRFRRDVQLPTKVEGSPWI
jgi:flagellar protein FlbD